MIFKEDKYKERILLLRNALIGLVGASDVKELEVIEFAARALPMPAKDRAAAIDAIHALIETSTDIEEAI